MRLPAVTRALLLHAALWATDDRPAALIARAVPGGDLAGYAPAERAALVTIDDGVIVFADPPVADVSVARQRQAHRQLAAVLAHEPDRQAWHLAEAGDTPPADRAQLYEQASRLFLQVGRPQEAARALRLAADAAPDDPQAPARLVQALETGTGTGTAELWQRIRDTTTDPRLLARAAAAAASAMVLTGEPDLAFQTACGALTSGPVSDPLLADGLLSVAGLAALASGAPADRARLAELTAQVHRTLPSAPGSPEWKRRDAGIAAWLHDDPRTAIHLLRDPLEHLHADAHSSPDPHRELVLLLALTDNGRWDEAATAAEDLAAEAQAAGLTALAAGAGIARATIQALRGDGPGGSALLTTATAAIGLHRNGFLHMLVIRAKAIVGIAENDFSAAYTYYTELFDHEGRPAVHWAANRLVSELALSARRVGDTALARRVVAQIRRGPEAGSPRLRFALDLAEGLTAEDHQAARRSLHAAATGPAGQAWPGDHAVALHLYALQLRRERCFTDAEPLLRQALDYAHRLGAQALVTVVHEALRANGNTADPISGSAFARLTAQQQDIVRLAAEGLRNREIAQRLHLSERTIGSHLYHIFPKLGVAGRSQLRRVIP